MKTKLISKIFILFFCSLIFTSAISAQEKPIAIKSDEYIENKEVVNLELLREKTKQFVKRMQSEPKSTQAVINYHHSLPKRPFGCNVYDDLKEVHSPIGNMFTKELKPIKGNVKMQAGDFQEYSKVEFWIVPENAEIPKPIAGYLFHPPICCPTVEISGYKTANNKKAPVKFTVQMLGSSTHCGQSEFKWKVSAGKIVKGQGTPTIKVNSEGAREITATVEINGLCEECQREASFTTKIQ